jgi:hypothetical protein
MQDDAIPYRKLPDENAETRGMGATGFLKCDNAGFDAFYSGQLMRIR